MEGLTVGNKQKGCRKDSVLRSPSAPAHSYASIADDAHERKARRCLLLLIGLEDRTIIVVVFLLYDARGFLATLDPWQAPKGLIVTINGNIDRKRCTVTENGMP